MVKQIVLALVAECSGAPSARGGWGLKRATSRSLAFHRQFHPDELDGAEIPVAKFSTHFSMHARINHASGRRQPAGKTTSDPAAPRMQNMNPQSNQQPNHPADKA
jgi:hypothetical protein